MPQEHQQTYKISTIIHNVKKWRCGQCS